jgi:hypothetical protein
VYNLGLDEFFAWYGKEPRAGFTKATVAAWRVALEASGLGAVSINVRITAVRKRAVEAADNGLLAPELAASITRIKGIRSNRDFNSNFYVPQVNLPRSMAAFVSPIAIPVPVPAASVSGNGRKPPVGATTGAPA